MSKEEFFVGDLRDEEWREYHIEGRKFPYRINRPVTLYMRKGGTGHRVLDADGIVHWIPMKNTLITWKPKNINDPVKW